MPQLFSTCFGEIEYPPASVFRFPIGLPGFESERAFVFLERPNTNPLMFMHSLINPDLCFILLPILAVDPHYRLALSPEDCSALQLPPECRPRIGEDVLCGAVVCAGDTESDPTINLLAPIVVNLKEGIGVQVIQTQSGYSHRHPLFALEKMATCS